MRSIKGRSKMESIPRDECKHILQQLLVQLDVTVIWHTQKVKAPSDLSSRLAAYLEPDATHDMLDDTIIGPVIQWNFEKGKRVEDNKGSCVIALANECTKDDVHKSS